MRFSIITPSYNQLDWLRLCVASVRDQVSEELLRTGQSPRGPAFIREKEIKPTETTIPHGSTPLSVEHIIQDANSSGIEEFAREVGADFYRDGTRVFAAGHPPLLTLPYRIVIYCESDSGMYDALNRGLDRTTGDICAWLNCDEQYLPSSLARVAQYFHHSSNCDILFGDAVLLTDGGIPFSYRRVIIPSLGYLRTVSPNLFSCSAFFRKTIIDSGIIFQPQWKILGDAVWFHAVLSSGWHPETMKVPLAAFAMTGQNLSDQRDRTLQEWKQWRHQLNYHPWVPRPLLVVWHRFKKFLAGAYRSRQLNLRLYRPGLDSQRTLFSAQLGFFWKNREAESKTGLK